MELRLNKDTQLCMSLSARPGNFGTRFQNFLYHELQLNFVYKAFTTTDIRASVQGIRALGIRGSAISMPFKESCMEFLDHLDPSASGIMSVNTIVNNQGQLTGYNTDYAAVYSLLKSCKVSTESEFVILGSGGMAKAVVCALKNAGFKKGTIVARNPVTGPALAKQYGFQWKPQLMDEKADLLVNVTPIGMTGPDSGRLAFSEEKIQKAETIFDVVAVPAETPLIQAAKRLGKKTISGADVIVLQAVEQFVLYTGIRPEPELIQKAAQFAL